MALFWFILGTVLGSFYLVYATRVPKGEDFINSRSKCDHCGYILKWYNLIPLFSFIIQSGKCCKCGKKISSELVNITSILVKLHLFLIDGDFISTLLIKTSKK